MEIHIEAQRLVEGKYFYLFFYNLILFADPSSALSKLCNEVPH
jgi:hypothetical protein